MSSKYLMNISGYKPEFSDSIYNSTYNKYKSLIELGGFSKFITDSEDIMTMCTELNEIQTLVVTELKKNLYAK